VHWEVAKFWKRLKVWESAVDSEKGIIKQIIKYKPIIGGVMRKIIVSIFLVLTFLCSPAMSETAIDLVHKATALMDENGKHTFTDPMKAIEYLNKAIKLRPDFTDAYMVRGLAYADLGQQERAVEDFTKAIRLKPNAILYNLRGLAYGNQGQYQLAITDYNEAIRLQPDFADAYFRRGLCYFTQDNNGLGCHDAQKACELGNCKLLDIAKDKGKCR
jgi:tetratricopeptide (TPR) repeat protein